METPMNIHSAVIVAALGGIVIGASALPAQDSAVAGTRGKAAHWEFVVPSGALVPTGAQRGAIKRANLTAVQLAYVPRPSLAITSTLGWARSRDLATAGDPKLDVFTYDVGGELRAPRWQGRSEMSFSAFAGMGAGGRSYDYRKLHVDATHNLAAYGSAGGELGFRRIRLRLEARDYVTGFKPLVRNGASRTGNDVVVMAGLRLVSR
jgi:hypothetical protein